MPSSFELAFGHSSCDEDSEGEEKDEQRRSEPLEPAFGLGEIFPSQERISMNGVLFILKRSRCFFVVINLICVKHQSMQYSSDEWAFLELPWRPY